MFGIFFYDFPSINPYMPSERYYPYLVEKNICHLRVVWCTFYFYVVFNKSCCTQTEQTLIRRRVLRRLIWVRTVYLCPFYGIITPYKPVVPFLGHRQTMQTQIRCRRTRCLIRFFIVCSQEFLSKI